jgi:hypothetical protein
VRLAVAVPAAGWVASEISGADSDLSIKKITTAASVINKANKPSAAGKLRVISGNRLARTSEFFFESALTSSSVPQTRHLVADSFKRVPQTGQSFVLEEFVSGLIIILD